MPGAGGQLKALWKNIIGGTAPSGAASATGDIGQMVKYTAAGSVAAYQSAKKVSDVGYQVVPSAAAGVVVTPGSSWANGSYVEITASTGAAWYVVGFQADHDQTLVQIEIDIATGGAGAESVKGTIPISNRTAAGELVSVFFPYPIAVAATTRIAARARSSIAGTPTLNLKLIYVLQSNLVAL